jgi:hypothetical protein
MSLTCANLSDRLVDYLYGEVAPDELERIEDHLRECESCQGEVASLGRTLGRARQALRGPLAQEAPAGVRAEIMKAARAAVPSLAGAAGAPASATMLAGSSMAGAPLPGPHRPRQQQDVAEGGDAGVSGFWRWVKRPWFFPAFAAVSAMALFFIARPALMKPRAPASVGEQDRQSVAEEPPAAPAPAAPRAAPPPDRSQKASAGGGPATRELRRTASAPPAKRARAERREREAQGGLRGRASGSEEGGADSERAPILQPGGPPRPAEPAPRTDVAMAPPAASPRDERRAASAPPPAVEPASAPRRVVAKDDSDEAESAAEAPAERKGRVGGVIAGTAGGLVGGARAAAPADRALAKLPLADLQKRATTAERQGRKAAAAATLRELLRRFPHHRDAPQWRTRLQAALR